MALRSARVVGGVALAVALASMGLSATAARANGRFPSSNAVVFSPANEATIMVRVTFGLLVTHDGGQSWRWICERAIGFSGQQDPPYVVTKSGAIVAGLYDGLRVSRDGGCSWESVKTDAGVFVDLTTRSDGAVVALASGYERHTEAGIQYKTQLFVSTDDASSFVPLGPRLDPALFAETVDVAPSDPSRIYISAVRGVDSRPEGTLLVSSDGAAHWTERNVVLEAKELAPFIAAVDPKRAERIFLRTSAAPDSATRLLVTDDAGKTYRTLLGAKGPLRGFALSSDGDTVHVGGPDDGLFTGRVEADGLAQISKLNVQCLGRSGDVLWACSNEASGFTAGTKRDGEGAFQARLHLRDIAGPIACGAETAVAKECGGAWKSLVNELGLGAGGGAGARADGGAGAATPAGEDPSRLRDRGAWLAAVVAAVGAIWLLLRSRRLRR